MATKIKKFEPTPPYLKHIAIGYCPHCWDVVVSPGGGRYVSCACGRSSIDQERFGGLYSRTIGDTVFIQQLCPSNCTEKSHKLNKKIND